MNNHIIENNNIIKNNMDLLSFNIITKDGSIKSSLWPFYEFSEEIKHILTTSEDNKPELNFSIFSKKIVEYYINIFTDIANDIANINEENCRLLNNYNDVIEFIKFIDSYNMVNNNILKVIINNINKHFMWGNDLCEYLFNDLKHELIRCYFKNNGKFLNFVNDMNDPYKLTFILSYFKTTTHDLREYLNEVQYKGFSSQCLSLIHNFYKSSTDNQNIAFIYTKAKFSKTVIGLDDFEYIDNYDLFISIMNNICTHAKIQYYIDCILFNGDFIIHVYRSFPKNIILLARGYVKNKLQKK